MTATPLTREFAALVEAEPIDLARAALLIARIEYPRLDPEPTLAALDRLGARAAERLRTMSAAPIDERAASLSQLLFAEEGFAGNRAQYGDFRNSLLNLVVLRRLGLPITLALVYMEVARRSGIEVLGVSFPGHFLVRIPGSAGDDGARPLVLDPFNGGRAVDEHDCRVLLRNQLGDDARFHASLLRPCTGRQFLARMLNNLKRTYVEQRSFPQARLATELLLTVEPTVGVDLRDRGLLAYHLDDYPAALRDLESYLKLRTWDADGRDERDRIIEHIKALRHRVAAFN